MKGPKNLLIKAESLIGFPDDQKHEKNAGFYSKKYTYQKKHLQSDSEFRYKK